MTNSALTSKTRERLIDTARQLFSRNGLENTTMTDIATASSKGRRTIYTYFRTKHEIYDAVIQSESAKVCDELQRVVDNEPTPEAKFRRLLEFRIDLASKSANRPEVWLGALFNRDTRRDVRIRAYVRDYVLATMDRIITDGVATGVFDPVQSVRVPKLLTVLMVGNDWSWLVDGSGDPANIKPSTEPQIKDVIDFIIDAILIKNNNKTT